MPIPVIICDDSSFARKQMARALPHGWNVAITYAKSGRDALDALRAGKGDVLFLDLTMPEMDGFEVLEAIRKEDLPTLPIVVSGDIQPEAEKRVRALGAVAFIKKPVDGDALCQVIRHYGLLDLLTHDEPLSNIEDESVSFTDWCQEIANVAMGRSADLLSRLLDVSVHLSIPQVQYLAPDELSGVFYPFNHEPESIVIQGFTGNGIAGETALILRDVELTEIADLLALDPETANDAEVLMGMANITLGAFLSAIADQLDIHFSQGQPMLHLHHHDRSLLRWSDNPPEQILTIGISYLIESRNIQCEQVIMFSEHALPSLKQLAFLSGDAA